ncbi:MAG: phospholipase [Baekduia sp.]
MTALAFAERPADGEPEGLLLLHHGRGSNEPDVLALAGALDPDRRLHIAAPRAPLQLPGSPGYHWYVVARVGFPDAVTFAGAFTALADFHDEIWERTGVGPERTVLGGFSMGAVMSYALGLAGERPAPAGVLAFSGFIPTVDGWQPDLESRPQLPVLIAHGDHDPAIEIGFAHTARDLLVAAGLPVSYHEFGGGHEIARDHLAAAAGWLGQVLG